MVVRTCYHFAEKEIIIFKFLLWSRIQTSPNSFWINRILFLIFLLYKCQLWFITRPSMLWIVVSCVYSFTCLIIWFVVKVEFCIELCCNGVNRETNAMGLKFGVVAWKWCLDCFISLLNWFFLQCLNKLASSTIFQSSAHSLARCSGRNTFWNQYRMDMFYRRF